MNETVLLTGASGFFGRRILRALEKRDYDVATPDRPEFDLLDRASVDGILNEVRPRTVIHSAAYYGGLGITLAERTTIFHRNVVMAANILDAAAHSGVKRFMSIGSACAYPGELEGSMSEDNFWSGPLHPSVEAYGFTKKVLLVGGKAYHSQLGMEVQHPIITNLYGEHDVFTEYRSHVVSALIKKFADAALASADEVVCWGTGQPIREFLYVGDAAEAVVRLLQTDYFEPLNIGTGVGTSIKDLAEKIAKYAGFKGRIVWDNSKPDGVMRKVLDISRMKQILKWEPEYDLDQGLELTISWYLDNKENADSRE